MPLLLAGLSIITLVSCFLAIRGLIRLYQAQQRKLAISSTIIFIILPLIIVAAIYQADNIVANIWLLLPLIVLFAFWVGFGYWLAYYMQQVKRQQLAGLEQVIPPRPAHHWRNNLLPLGAGIAIWVAGNFLPLRRLPILEVALLCLVLFLTVGACLRLWKYRGF